MSCKGCRPRCCSDRRTWNGSPAPTPPVYRLLQDPSMWCPDEAPESGQKAYWLMPVWQLPLPRTGRPRLPPHRPAPSRLLPAPRFGPWKRKIRRLCRLYWRPPQHCRLLRCPHRPVLPGLRWPEPLPAGRSPVRPHSGRPKNQGRFVRLLWKKPDHN